MTVDAAMWGSRASGVAELERELARLRRTRVAHAKEQGIAVARASVLNLIAYATRENHARRAARTIAELALRHPSRAIVVLGDPGAHDGITGGGLAMYCDLPQVGQSYQVCYEQILIRAKGDSDERIASAIIPLLLPDLPVFLWWTDTPPMERRHFDSLIALADRLIIDSADFARPDLTLPRISEICASGRGRFGVTDFNWTRLTAWRELIAALFDVAAWRPFLDQVTGIRIGFAVDADGRDIHPSQALLLLGWFASRLGWQTSEALAPSEAGGLLFAMGRPDGGVIRVRVRPRFERGLEAGDLSGLRLQAEHHGQRAEFVIKRQGAVHLTTTVSIDAAVVSSRTVPLSAPAVGDLLGEELTIVSSDAVYEEALAALVRLA